MAALSFSAVANQDLAGLILFSDQVERFLPPRKGRNNALEILREVLYYEPKGKKTSLQAACEYAYKMLKKRCIIFILSYKDSYSLRNDLATTLLSISLLILIFV